MRRVVPLCFVFPWAFSGCGDSSRSEQEIQREFDAYVAARNACSADAECVLASAGCPLGCSAAVNRTFQAAVEAKARELIAEYEQGCGCGCDYDCMATKSACVDAHCSAVPQ